MKTAAKDFKMTELGPIPEDWEVKRLGQLLEVRHGYAFSGDWFSKEANRAVLVTPINFRIGGGFKSNELRYYGGKYPSDYVFMTGVFSRRSWERIKLIWEKKSVRGRNESPLQVFCKGLFDCLQRRFIRRA